MSLAAFILQAQARLAALRALRPVIELAVDTAEALLPEGTPGRVKLDYAKGVVQEAVEKAEDIKDTFEDLLPSVTSFISALVTAKHALGIFRKRE